MKSIFLLAKFGGDLNPICHSKERLFLLLFCIDAAIIASPIRGSSCPSTNLDVVVHDKVIKVATSNLMVGVFQVISTLQSIFFGNVSFVGVL